MVLDFANEIVIVMFVFQCRVKTVYYIHVSVVCLFLTREGKGTGGGGGGGKVLPSLLLQRAWISYVVSHSEIKYSLGI